jgi:pimeloyl-ACP methyl ester carboxylesterase
MMVVFRTFFFLLVLATSVFAFTGVRTIATRPGITMDFLEMTPEQPRQSAALIFFPGGNGVGSFKIAEGGVVSGWSFLIRSADSFIADGMSVFTVAPPSDHSTGMSTGFRESAEHAEDIASLVTYLEQQGYERIFLVGNSRGTLSATSLGTRLKDSHIKGVILTSALEYENFLRWLPLEQLHLPVLMVHHRDDACRVSSIEEARLTEASLNATTVVDFTEVNGGAYPRSAPCDNLSAHGFFGMEEKVVRVITAWIGGHKAPERIE